MGIFIQGPMGNFSPLREMKGREGWMKLTWICQLWQGNVQK
jgi:hypothetical protein